MKNFIKLMAVLIYCNPWKSGAAQNSLIQNPNHFFIINRMALEMMSECYIDLKSILVHGDSETLTIELIKRLKSFNMILINESSFINHRPGLHMGTGLSLITPRSVVHLQEALKTFKNSPWWSIIMPYFILDNSPNSCNDASVILRAAWKMNLLKVFLFCVNPGHVAMIYSYNPYTSRAPQPWKLVPTTTNLSDGWTMYNQPYLKEYICESLDFDRTKYLSGAIIRVVVNLPKDKHWIPDKDYDESKIAEMYSFDSTVAKLFKRAWNVTLIINVDEEGFDTSREPDGFFKRLENGSSDVAFCLRSRQLIYNFTPTYPLIHSEYRIYANNRGFYTPWEKIKNFYGIVTLISLCIILTMVFTVIAQSGKTQCSFAGFEMLRLLVNAALLTRMNTLSLRIFYSMIFLYFLILHATFAGHLSAFLTKDQYRSNVETLEDLRDPKYHGIHIGAALVSYINDPILKKKLIIGSHDSIPRIIGNESAACIADIMTGTELVFKHKLHMSKESIGNSLYGFVVRHDWPLKDRFDAFLMQLEHAQLFRTLYAKHIYRIIESQKRITAMSEIDIRPIALPMLEFPLIIFTVGLTVAFICFVCELLIQNVLAKRRSRGRIPRRIIRHRRVLVDSSGL